jgi:hypothetical protein
MKHLDIKYFWLCDEVEKGHIAPVYIPTSDQIADIFTKALPRTQVERFCTMLGLKS